MPDLEKVLKGLEFHLSSDDCRSCVYWDGVKSGRPCEVMEDALALLKEQEETTNDLTETIRQLNQHIKDLSEYMTLYGKVKDVKAYAELLKEQETSDTRKARIFQCEKCGYGFDDIYLTDEHNYDIEPHYCPNCGRLVKRDAVD